MKKRFLVLVFTFVFLMTSSFSYINPTKLFADSKTYYVSVSLEKIRGTASSKIESAIQSQAEIVRDGDSFTYTVTFDTYKYLGTRIIEDLYIEGEQTQGGEGTFTFTLDELQSELNGKLKPSRRIFFTDVTLTFDVSEILEDIENEENNDGDDSNDNSDDNDDSSGDGEDNNDNNDDSDDNDNSNNNDNNTDDGDDSSDSHTEQIRKYEIPVLILKKDKEKQSMANKAVNEKATVIEKNGKYECSLYFTDLKFMGQKAGLKGLWVSENGAMKKAEHSNVGGKYKDKFTFVLDSKRDVIMSEFKVPVMPIRPKARIMLNWDGTDFDDYDDEDHNDNDDNNNENDNSGNNNGNNDNADNNNGNTGDNNNGNTGDNNDSNNDANNTNDDNENNNNNNNENNNADNNEQNNDEANNNDTSSNYEPDVEESDEDTYKTKYTLTAGLENVEGEESMANNALVKTVTVNETNGKYTYYVKFQAMKKEFGGKILEGNLTNLFYHDGSRHQASYHGNSEWSFTLNSKEDKIELDVWVDVMDEIMGGEPGAGEQTVYLVLDWDSATKVEKNNNDKEAELGAGGTLSEGAENLQATEETKAIIDAKVPLAIKPNSKVSYERFVDVKKTAWYANAISYILDKKIMSGTSNITFSPNEKASRAMITNILYRLEDKKTTEYSNLFHDVPKGRWYSDGIIWATNNRIVSGYGNKMFGPNDVLSREQLVTILYKYSEFKKYDLSKQSNLDMFSDKDRVSSYAKEPLAWAVKNGLISGTSKNQLSPKKDTTRAEIAVIIERFMKKIVN